MGITVYSLAISIVFYNLALIAVFILRRSPGFRARHTVSLLAFITVLGVVRLVLPIDFDAAYVVRSYKIIPAVEDFLRRPLAASFTYGHLLSALWAVGSLVMVIKDVRLQRRFDRYLQSIDFVDRPELLKIAAEYGNDFAVLISPQLNMPFTSGILHPVIYLPDVELSDAKWRMVFCHEITHIRSRDNLKKLFFLAVEALFWWNPVAHFSNVEINTLIELHCDAKVTVEMDAQERLDYIEALKMIMVRTSQCKLPSVSSCFAGTEMRQRFVSLQMRDNGSRSLYKIIIAIVCVVFVASYLVVVQPARMPDEQDILRANSSSESYLFHVNDSVDHMFFIHRNNQYELYVDSIFAGSFLEEAIHEPPYDTITIIGGN